MPHQPPILKAHADKAVHGMARVPFRGFVSLHHSFLLLVDHQQHAANTTKPTTNTTKPAADTMNTRNKTNKALATKPASRSGLVRTTPPPPSRRSKRRPTSPSEEKGKPKKARTATEEDEGEEEGGEGRSGRAQSKMTGEASKGKKGGKKGCVVSRLTLSFATDLCLQVWGGEEESPGEGLQRRRGKGVSPFASDSFPCRRRAHVARQQFLRLLSTFSMPNVNVFLSFLLRWAMAPH